MCVVTFKVTNDINGTEIYYPRTLTELGYVTEEITFCPTLLQHPVIYTNSDSTGNAHAHARHNKKINTGWADGHATSTAPADLMREINTSSNLEESGSATAARYYRSGTGADVFQAQ